MMNIQLRNLEPAPLRETPTPSTVWRADVVFDAGKSYLLTAPSGKGKSTLLHILYGLRSDYEGTAQIAGRDVQSNSPDDWATIRREQLAIVFQDLRLFPKLTALQNLLLKNRLTDFRTETEIRYMAAALEIDTFLNQTAETLSYGQRQRVAIIRALCQPCAWMLLDEPFSHLDSENIRRACTLIAAERQRQKAGLLLVSLGERYELTYDEQRTL